MNKTKDLVGQLLGDYYNSEEDVYQQYKKQLTEGVWLKFKGPKVKPLDSNLAWVHFLEIIAKGSFAVNYDESSMDTNINFWVFSDERMECVIETQGKRIAKFKTDFSAYASYNITARTPDLVDDKNITYRVFFKLTKSGKQRETYEQDWFDNPTLKAQEFMGKIQKSMTDFPKSTFVKYATKVNLIKKRTLLWGHKILTKKQLLSILPALTQQDFGIKDVIELELLATIFFNEKLSNEKLMSNAKGIVKARRKVRYEPG